MAQLDPSDRVRIVTEGKKREEQDKDNIAKLARDLSISRKRLKIKHPKIIHFYGISKV